MNDTSVGTQNFDDLAVIAIFHFADSCYKQKALWAYRRLKRQGIVETFGSLEDGQKAYQLYEAAYADYVLGQLPNDYVLTYDYWGARCFDNSKGRQFTKNGLFSGDGAGELSWYADSACLIKYTKEVVARLDAERADAEWRQELADMEWEEENSLKEVC